MSPSKRLKPVQQVAASKERNAARSMGQAKQHLAQQEAKLHQLKTYHQEYLGRFQKAASQGISATQLQEYRAFLAKLDSAIREQEKVVAESTVRHTNQKDNWKQKRTRTQALGKVVERYRKEERKAADLSEQKENDEHNTRSK
ncbi:MAG: flagellar export protein FliJ [Candidatus Thiodiazotropha sp. (ex Monitilora ramsayi)]|nr:flagellar export protein FliJ [Candidatus Thiodiazotropha sp. (ex Monitilora ramsayi)]